MFAGGVSAKVYLYPIVLTALLLSSTSSSAGLVGKTYGQALRFFNKTVATTGLLLMCGAMGCKAPEQDQAMPKPTISMQQEYQGRNILFIGAEGLLSEASMRSANNLYRDVDWFWVRTRDNDEKIPVYARDIIGVLSPDHASVGMEYTGSLLIPLNSLAENLLLDDVHATVERVYTDKKVVIEEGDFGKRLDIRYVPTGYAITVHAATLIEDGKRTAFHIPYTLLVPASGINVPITESDIYN